MSQHPLPDNLHIDTLAVRAAIDRSQYGENSEALYLTSGYVQPDAETAAIDTLSHLQAANFWTNMAKAGFTASVTCCALSSALGVTSP